MQITLVNRAGIAHWKTRQRQIEASSQSESLKTIMKCARKPDLAVLYIALETPETQAPAEFHREMARLHRVDRRQHADCFRSMTKPWPTAMIPRIIAVATEGDAQIKTSPMMIFASSKQQLLLYPQTSIRSNFACCRRRLQWTNFSGASPEGVTVE